MAVTIDGIDLESVCLVDGLSETFTLLEGASSQRTQAKTMWYDIIGTEVSHTLTLRRRNSASDDDWETLWATLRRPISYHSVVMPDGPNGTMTYNAHIATGSRAADYIDSDGVWHYGDFTLTITAISPQITED